MYRRSLILRRFGELSFGLGYVEDGVWVDHSVAFARGEDLLATASDSERATLDAIHAWHTCCDGGAVTEERVIALAESASS